MMTDILPLLGLLCIPPIAALGRSRWGRSLLMAIGIVDRTNAGSKRWCRLERNAAQLPVSRLSRT